MLLQRTLPERFENLDGAERRRRPGPRRGADPAKSVAKIEVDLIALTFWLYNYKTNLLSNSFSGNHLMAIGMEDDPIRPSSIEIARPVREQLFV